MKLHYQVTVVMTSGRGYTTPKLFVEGAEGVGEDRLKTAVEEQVANTWQPGGLFDLGKVESWDGEVSLAVQHIELIEIRWLGTGQPPAAAGGIPADYADSAE